MTYLNGDAAAPNHIGVFAAGTVFATRVLVSMTIVGLPIALIAGDCDVVTHVNDDDRARALVCVASTIGTCALAAFVLKDRQTTFNLGALSAAVTACIASAVGEGARARIYLGPFSACMVSAGVSIAESALRRLKIIE